MTDPTFRMKNKYYLFIKRASYLKYQVLSELKIQQFQYEPIVLCLKTKILAYVRLRGHRTFIYLSRFLSSAFNQLIVNGNDAESYPTQLLCIEIEETGQ